MLFRTLSFSLHFVSVFWMKYSLRRNLKLIIFFFLNFIWPLTRNVENDLFIDKMRNLILRMKRFLLKSCWHLTQCYGKSQFDAEAKGNVDHRSVTFKSSRKKQPLSANATDMLAMQSANIDQPTLSQANGNKGEKNGIIKLNDSNQQNNEITDIPKK